MPSWRDLLHTFDLQSTPDDKVNWLYNTLNEYLNTISAIRGDRNVLFYGTAFLQKPTANQFLQQITHEDINGYMTTIHGMDCTKGLTLLMHVPGGITNATETIVSYLRSKFDDIEVVVPAIAMSGGTMISLSANRIVMGRQSQLGPIDPQMPINGRMVSAIAILDQFETAKKDISEDVKKAHLWAPMLPGLGPALIQECQNAIDYSEQIVADWLEKYMFSAEGNPAQISQEVSKYFSRGSEDVLKKRSHGRRIDREEAKGQGVIIEDLEDNQDFQEAVLTAYHLMTITFEKTPAVKIIASNAGSRWVKNG